MRNLTFDYDAADRISKITNGIDGALTQSFGYDAMSRLNSVASTASNESYQYDANGNRTSQVVNGVSTISTVSATSNRLVSFGGTAFGYDANGNTTSVAGAATYHYDAFNRMDSAAGMNYYVNPEGQRLRKSGSTGTSYFAPDQSNAMLSEYTGEWIDYVWLNGRLIGRVAGGQIYAIHDDQVGRPETVTNASKAIVWRAQNFAFNQKVVTSGITFNLGFPGQYYDAETAAWNNGYRDYKSELGRYLESDPIGFNGGINTYTYAGGNPINYVDPLGLFDVRAYRLPNGGGYMYTVRFYSARFGEVERKWGPMAAGGVSKAAKWIGRASKLVPDPAGVSHLSDKEDRKLCDGLDEDAERIFNKMTGGGSYQNEASMTRFLDAFFEVHPEMGQIYGGGTQGLLEDAQSRALGWGQ